MAFKILPELRKFRLYDERDKSFELIGTLDEIGSYLIDDVKPYEAFDNVTCPEDIDEILRKENNGESGYRIDTDFTEYHVVTDFGERIEDFDSLEEAQDSCAEYIKQDRISDSSVGVFAKNITYLIYDDDGDVVDYFNP